MGNANDWVFYHALYHLLAHWAAFMATFGLLVSVGVALSAITPPIDGARRHYCLAAVLVILLGSWFFLWRMFAYSSVVNPMLPAVYFQQISILGLVPGPLLLVISALGTCGIAGLALRVLFQRDPKGDSK